MALRAGGLTAFVLASCLPTTATASQVAVTNETDPSPVVVGDGVAWSENTCVRGCGPEYVDCPADGATYRYRIRLASTSRAPRSVFAKTLECASSGPNFFRDEVSFLISSSRLVLEETASEGSETGADSDRVRVRAGAVGGLLTPLLRCSGQLTSTSPLALEGDLLAYDPDPCDDSFAQLVFRDLATGAARTMRIPGATRMQQLRLAGRFAAFVDADSVRVFEHQRGVEVYRAPIAAGRAIQDVALQADGKLALESIGSDSAACEDPELAWYSPSEPGPHRLDARPCGRIRLVGDRIYAHDRSRRELAEIGLAGGRRALVRLGPLSRLLFGGVDSDGTTIAYALPRCRGDSAIYSRSVQAKAVSAGPLSCPIAIAGRRLRASPRRLSVLPLRCPRGCQGVATVRAGRRAVARRSFRLGPSGRVRRLRIRVSRRVHMGRTYPVTIQVAGRDRAYRVHRVRRRGLLVAGL